jgi:hypothetical protein
MTLIDANSIVNKTLIDHLVVSQETRFSTKIWFGVSRSPHTVLSDFKNSVVEELRLFISNSKQ